MEIFFTLMWNTLTHALLSKYTHALLRKYAHAFFNIVNSYDLE